MKLLLIFLLLPVVAFAGAEISFLIDGQEHKSLTLAEVKKMKAEEVEYFHRLTKRAEKYRGVSTLSLLESVYPDFAKKYVAVEFKTKNEFYGYHPVDRLQKFHSILAYERADGDTFTRFSTRTQTLVRLAPLYLVWNTKNITRQERDVLTSLYQIHSINVLTKKIELINSNEQIMKGYAIYKAQCLSCHALGSLGGKSGGNLVERKVLQNRGTDYVKRYLINPRSLNPKSVMLPIYADDKEAAATSVIEFLEFAQDPEKKVQKENPKSSSYSELKNIVQELQK